MLLKFLIPIFLLVPSISFAQEEIVRIYADQSDGTIATAPYPGSWNLQVNNFVGRDPNLNNPRLVVGSGASKSSAGAIAIYRSFVPFEISSLPDGATIESVNLILKPYSVVNQVEDENSFIQVFKSTQSVENNLTYDDVDECGVTEVGDGHLMSEEFRVSDLLVDEAISVPLDLNKLNDLFDGTHVNLCLREGHDFNDIEIVNNSGTWLSSAASFYSSEFGEENAPYLEITYTLPEPTVEELIEALEVYVVGLVGQVQLAVTNSYDAQVKKLLKFYQAGQWEAFGQQLGALRQKIEFDVATGKLASFDGDALLKLIDAIESAVADEQTQTDDVPLITQVASPYPLESSEWANDLFGDGAPDWCGNTIAGCGCAITSLTMLAKHQGVHTGLDGNEVRPDNLNDWLNANHGYTALNEVRWHYALQYFSDQIGFSHFAFDQHNEKDMSVIDSYVNAKLPAIAFKRSKGHYFVLTDVLGGGLYGVNDPYWYETKTTDDVKDIANNVQGYGGAIDQANLFSYSSVAKPLPKWIEIQLGSPAELLLTDSEGRRAGYDSVTGEVVTEIPGSSYAQAEGVLTEDVPDPNAHLPKVLMVQAPADAFYELEVIGTGVGEYTLSVDTGGGYEFSELSTVASSTEPGQIDRFIIDVPERDSSARAVERLNELAGQKEATQPTVAGKLRAIAERLADSNVAAAVGVELE